MAMKKAEMEEHASEYYAHMAAARAADGKGLFRVAVQAAKAAWAHVDGMMQYEQKYQDREFTSVPAIDLVLRYAPLLLDHASLAELESLFENYRRITKKTTDNLHSRLQEGRERIWANHRLWSHLELHPETRQDALRGALGGSQEYWRSVAEAWERMGLLCRTHDGASYRLALATRMGQVVSGKCPHCGRIAQAPKAMLLEQTTCPYCHATVHFVILAQQGKAEARE